ncbi:MAG: gfo/Idh/MocA family oxidoreductase, partial [Planctomycetes bacterium]|nr:gfo/Idh/MocA family oxidoreductase [Planctomycetota bacterium]
NTKYANGMKMIISGGHSDIRSGTKWIGTDGWVRVDRGGVLETNNPDLLRQKAGPNDIHLFKSPGHSRNFLDCIKTRSDTITPVEVAHHSILPGHLGQIAMLTGRKLKFDPKTEKIIGDSVASRMLGKTMRAPWQY